METLARKTLSKCAVFIILLAAMLFLTAWTFRYWQAWLFLVVMAVPSFYMTLYFLKHDPALIERRQRVGPLDEKEKSQRVIQSFTAILTIAMYIVSALDDRFGWSVIPGWLVLVGDIGILLGFLAFFVVFKENSYTSGIIEVTGDQKVIQTGPYRIVRHPMYSGALVFFLATPLALGSAWAVIVSVLICLAIVWRLLDEERFLKTALKGYKEYCYTTRYRLIPFIW